MIMTFLFIFSLCKCLFCLSMHLFSLLIVILYLFFSPYAFSTLLWVSAFSIFVLQFFLNNSDFSICPSAPHISSSCPYCSFCSCCSFTSCSCSSCSSFSCSFLLVIVVLLLALLVCLPFVLLLLFYFFLFFLFLFIFLFFFFS